MKLVQLFTKRYCGLCEEAFYQLSKIQLSHPFTLEVVDLEKPENERWNVYVYDVPVVHLNDKLVMKHRIDKEAFVKLLKESNDASTP